MAVATLGVLTAAEPMQRVYLVLLQWRQKFFSGLANSVSGLRRLRPFAMALASLKRGMRPDASKFVHRLGQGTAREFKQPWTAE